MRRECGAWVIAAFVQIVHMQRFPAILLCVHRKEKRHDRERLATGKARDGGCEGLEVEMAHRGFDLRKHAAEIPVQDGALVEHCRTSHAL